MAILFISFSLTYLNWRGLQIVSKASMLVLVFSLAPFIALIYIGAPQVSLQLFVTSLTVDCRSNWSDSQQLFPWGRLTGHVT